MLGGTIQEPWIQRVNVGFLLSDSTKNTPTFALVCFKFLNKLMLMLGFFVGSVKRKPK
jgi:hypothetical protein